MDESYIEPDTVWALIKIRRELLFVLCDQHEPPEQYAAPLWQAYNLLAEGIEALKVASCIDEEKSDVGWTAFPPK